MYCFDGGSDVCCAAWRFLPIFLKQLYARINYDTQERTTIPSSSFSGVSGGGGKHINDYIKLVNVKPMLEAHNPQPT